MPWRLAAGLGRPAAAFVVGKPRDKAVLGVRPGQIVGDRFSEGASLLPGAIEVAGQLVHLRDTGVAARLDFRGAALR